MPDQFTSPDHDPRISPIFYYFEQYTSVSTGRTVGRKIGVVQEIVVRKLLLQSQAVRDRIVFEPSVRGGSGASHKVEFVVLMAEAIAEGKPGETIKLSDVSVQLRGSDYASQRAQLAVSSRGSGSRVTTTPHAKIPERQTPFLAERGLRLKVVSISADGTVRVVLLREQELLASLESKRVGAQRFSNSKNLGSGIQTIEKAKQTALAALDIDLKQNGTIKPLAGEDSERRCVSFVLLGNGVHWTDKDKNILRTYVDYAYLTKDSAILRYAEFVRAIAETEGEEFMKFFMNYFQGMTKTAADDFDVTADDFVIIEPSGETRTMIEVLENQVSTFNDL